MPWDERKRATQSLVEGDREGEKKTVIASFLFSSLPSFFSRFLLYTSKEKEEEEKSERGREEKTNTSLKGHRASERPDDTNK